MPIADVARRMLESYPRDYNVETDVVVHCIEACHECAHACTACADDCLSEDNVAQMTKCIRLNLDCADICQTTGRVLSRQTEYDAKLTHAIVEACVQSCKSCGDECDRHAQQGTEHCRICSDACRGCEQACRQLLSAIA
jgi:hypothetical protein